MLSVTTLTLFSIAAYVLLSLVLKVSAQRAHSDQVITVAFGTVALLATVLAIATGEWNGTLPGAVIAVVAGAIFFAASFYRMRALETASASLVFAITNLDLVVSGAAIMLVPVFGIQTSPKHILAIIIAGGAILVGQRVKGIENLPSSAFLSLALLSIASIGYITYAAFFTPLVFFIVLNHLAGFILNIKALPGANKGELGWGIAAGSCMFIGFWTLMSALSMSCTDIPSILLALSMRTPITALLAVPIFKEQLNPLKMTAMALATIAVILWQVDL